MFAYITHEPTTGLNMCHAFQVKKNVSSLLVNCSFLTLCQVEKIPEAMNQAFMMLAEAVSVYHAQHYAVVSFILLLTRAM